MPQPATPQQAVQPAAQLAPARVELDAVGSEDEPFRWPRGTPCYCGGRSFKLNRSRRVKVVDWGATCWGYAVGGAPQ
jgi:hypothetical protein